MEVKKSSEISPLKPWLPTYTGKVVDILDPKPEMVDIHDIAHTLSMTCRFGGHCRDFYSVAEHSMLVLSLAEDHATRNPSSFPDGLTWECFMAAFLHDAAEAYVGDLISPIKRTIPDFVVLEKTWQGAIDLRFKLGGTLSCSSPLLESLIKTSDERALAIEVVCLYPNPHPGWWKRFDPPTRHDITCFSIEGLSPQVARLRFLQKFFELESKRGNVTPWVTSTKP